MASLRFSSLRMAASRFSPRTRWITGAIAIVALLYGAFVYWERSAWRPLPHGGEARLFQIGYGENMRLKQRGFQLDAARKWLGPRFEFLLGPAPFELRSTFAKPSLFVAFASRGSTVDDLPRTGYCEIDLPGGQILRGTPHNLGTVRGEKVDLASFPLVPGAQQWLNVRLEFGGKSLPFRLKNPAYIPKRPVWKAKPLPQTQTIGDLDVTLDRISVERNYSSHIGSFWAAEPHYTITVRRNPPAGEQIPPSDCKFCDPSGNESTHTALFSEPVWKVRVTLLQSVDEVPDSNIRWLGRMPVPGPGEGRIFAGGLGTPGTRRHLCGLVGPGHYHLINGKLVSAPWSPIEDPRPRIDTLAPPPSKDPDADEAAFEIHATTTTLFVIPDTSLPPPSPSTFNGNSTSAPPTLLVRDPLGRRLELDYVSDGYFGTLSHVPLPPGGSEIEIGLTDCKLHFDFYVPSPAPPPELHR